MVNRFLRLLTVLLLLLPAIACAENAAPAAEDGAFPTLNMEGFLDAGEFVYANAEAGVWRYVDDELKIEIYRRIGENQKGNQAT